MLLCVRHIEADIRAALQGGVALKVGDTWIRQIPTAGQGATIAAANDPPRDYARQLPLFLVAVVPNALQK